MTFSFNCPSCEKKIEAELGKSDYCPHCNDLYTWEPKVNGFQEVSIMNMEGEKGKFLYTASFKMPENDL